MTDAAARACEQGHDMLLVDRFRFDHEPGEIERDRLSLDRLKALGIELGADVVVWYCPACDTTTAVFSYPGQA